MAAVRFCLDYPGVNCRQCRDNLREDGVEPVCSTPHPAVGEGAGGSACPVSLWDTDTHLAMALYERTCPWGELDYMAVQDACNDLEIPNHKRRLMRRILPAIHREIKQAAQRQAN
jgi:hypothetical protein